MTKSRYSKHFGLAIAAGALLVLGLLVGSAEAPAAPGSGPFLLDQASTSTTPPPTTLATASASPTDKAPPFGKK